MKKSEWSTINFNHIDEVWYLKSCGISLVNLKENTVQVPSFQYLFSKDILKNKRERFQREMEKKRGY